MKTRFLIAILSLTSCSPSTATSASSMMINNRWITKEGDCSTNYVLFSQDRITFFNKNGHSSDFKVKKIIDGTKAVPTTMFVVEMQDAQGAGKNGGNAKGDIAFAFGLQGDTVHLIGDGNPESLMPAKPENYTYRMFDLHICPHGS